MVVVVMVVVVNVAMFYNGCSGNEMVVVGDCGGADDCRDDGSGI